MIHVYYLKITEDVTDYEREFQDRCAPEIIMEDAITDNFQNMVDDASDYVCNLERKAEQLRKERDELAKAVIILNKVCGSCIEAKYISQSMDKAKRIIENGNA